VLEGIEENGRRSIRLGLGVIVVANLRLSLRFITIKLWILDIAG
jgi:hypothetical protein